MGKNSSYLDPKRSQWAWTTSETFNQIITKASSIYSTLYSETDYYPIFNRFSSVPQLCATLCNPWTAACQASLSITNSWNLLKLMSIKSVMPSNHLILCHTLLLPSIFPSIKQPFKSISAAGMRRGEREGPKLDFFSPPLHFSFAWGRSYLSGTSEGTWLLAHSAFTIFGSKVSFVPKLFEMSSSSVN